VINNEFTYRDAVYAERLECAVQAAGTLTTQAGWQYFWRDKRVRTAMIDTKSSLLSFCSAARILRGVNLPHFSFVIVKMTLAAWNL